MPKKDTAKGPGKYEAIISDIFFRHWKTGLTEFVFDREEIHESADRLKLARVKNAGDVVYSYRYRKQLPDDILATQPENLG